MKVDNAQKIPSDSGPACHPGENLSKHNRQNSDLTSNDNYKVTIIYIKVLKKPN